MHSYALHTKTHACTIHTLQALEALIDLELSEITSAVSIPHDRPSFHTCDTHTLGGVAGHVRVSVPARAGRIIKARALRCGGVVCVELSPLDQVLLTASAGQGTSQGAVYAGQSVE